MKLTELSYHRNSAELFELIAGEPWSILLDSGYPFITQGRFDIMASRPYCTLVTRGERTWITEQGRVTVSTEDPFELVKRALGKNARNFSGIPFCGGALGYFGYDLGRRLERLPEHSADDLPIPDMAIGLYDRVAVVDHQRRRTWLIGEPRAPRHSSAWNDLERLLRSAPQARIARFSAGGPVRSNMDKAGYTAAFNRIKHYIKEGDCYQVNLAQRFTIPVQGDGWDVYLQLRKSNPAPFAGFMRLPDGCVLSSSPERFLNVCNGLVETKPIKGTIRRSVFAYEDKALAAQLLESEKDRAENLMIVDLLRNDLGKNCQIGSVAVPRLFALESFATVHHLVSTVTGKLAEGRHALDLLRGCFPGGSITGAPKVRAMEIIEELEPHRRYVYCGSLGYVGFDGAMDTNIAIRTAVQCGDNVHFWAGGGIVSDSTADSEYDECFIKARGLSRIFEGGAIQNVAG